MSRHIFHTTHGGEEIEVAMGWDRPMGHFYLTVERLPAKGSQIADEESFLYSNLQDPQLPRGGSPSLQYFRNKLKELGIVVPQSLFSEAQRDADNQVVNRQVIHDADGTLHEREPGSARQGR